MANFTAAIATLLKHEGGFAAEDNWRGAVNFGITQKTYDELKYPDKGGAWPRRVALLTRGQAQRFYEDEFWTPMRVQVIQDQKLAELYFSLGVNCGARKAIRWLQEAASEELRVDGVFGPKTEAAIRARHPRVMVDNLKDLAWEHYHDLHRKKPELCTREQLKGWMNRLADLTGDDSIRIR